MSGVNLRGVSSHGRVAVTIVRLHCTMRNRSVPSRVGKSRTITALSKVESYDVAASSSLARPPSPGLAGGSLDLSLSGINTSRNA